MTYDFTQRLLQNHSRDVHTPVNIVVSEKPKYIGQVYMELICQLLDLDLIVTHSAT